MFRIKGLVRQSALAEMSNNRSFLKEINQYPLLRYSAVPCSAVQNKGFSVTINIYLF